MMGRNRMVLCEAQVLAALQHYFDTFLFRDGKSPQAETVRESADMGSRTGSHTFEVQLAERPEEGAA